ncbi:sorting nexin-2 isoform X9 [Macrobrachium rosenbergii]|uniref:sorting nexin-2 isoform X9 n=1 Tax=Macrobrachium rosenbergii TaxID=79674 RepID=UPI0034D65125
MADSREPPPLFNDDDDSHKDDDNDDLFTSAVQSPVSELTTPEEPRRQEGLGDPLTSPSPAASPTPDPPSDSHAGNPTDLFESVGEPPVGGLSSVSLESPTGGEGTQQELPSDPDTTLEVSLDDEVDDSALFNATSAPKLQLSQDVPEPPVPASSILPPMGAPLTPPVAPITPTVTPNLTPNVTPAAPAPVTPLPAVRQSPEELEAESGDEFIEIQVSDPQKIGEGMSSYMAYKVTTKTNITYFRKKNWSVTRRFSDFLGLHGKLVEKHLHSGRIIPPAPEKSAIGTTKIKLGSDKTAESGSQDFIEKRRASLERYMNRTGAHPTLRADPDFREFIELDAELPRATQTSALSSAGVLRLFNRVGETVNKMTFKMDESDQAEGQWFEEKTQQIESLDAQLRKLHLAMEGLVAYRRELAVSTASFAKSAAILSSVEEHSALSRALHQLAESTERTHTIHHAQADADFYYLSEITKDYIQLIGAVKDVFHERVKTFQTWQHAQSMLAKKREAKAKAELAGRMDKVQQAQEEVAEWEVKVERSQEEFDRISRAIKKEVDRFDVVRVKDFKDMLVKYLEALMTSQQQIIKVWETFMPEAKAIA